MRRSDFERERNEFIFHEGSFVRRNEPEWMQMSKRGGFVFFISNFISIYTETTQLHKFNLSLSRPHYYPEDVRAFINFAVSRGVKHLELEFYEPVREECRIIDPAQGFPLPPEVRQHHGNLQSLKLVWCNFDVSSFTPFKNLETLTLGWITLTTSQLRDLMSCCPILHSLRLQSCSGMSAFHISLPDNSSLKNLEVDKCNLETDDFLVEGPKLIKVFYTGKVAVFELKNQRELVEARLDFVEQVEFVTGPLLCNLLEQLVHVKFMTVCSVFLQIIPSGDRHYATRSELNVQHLTMNTELHVRELIGIKFMLASCQRMNTLTLCLRPGKIFHNYDGPYETTSPANLWDEALTAQTSIRESLLVLNVRGFRGKPDEMTFIEFIINCCCCLTSVNLHLPQAEHNASDNSFIKFVLGKASHLMRRSPRANPDLEILVFNPVTVRESD